MDTLASQVWQQRGSSIIFDSLVLGNLLAQNQAISLRQSLGWLDRMPAEPPSASILIYGLQTMLEILAPDAAYAFLLQRMRPLLMQLQHDWQACGVILAFTAPPLAFQEDAVDDDVLYVRNDQERIRLSDGLWGASASVNLRRLVNNDAKTIGYYVARIS